MVAFQRCEGSMGAEVTGVDLARPLDPETFSAVRNGLHTHHVLVFRGQRLAPQEFHAFASRFGPPEPHLIDQFHHPAIADILILSNVVRDGKPTGLADAGTYWHTDYSYFEIPARTTMLYSLQVPKIGGDTLFADQEQAYADLPDEVKRRLEGLVTLNIYGNRDDQDPQSRTIASPLNKAQQNQVNVVRHPLVRRHPYSGRKALYAVSGTSFAIEGMGEEEGLDLLRKLASHSTQPKYQYRVKYRVGDVVMWDNASVLHSATLTDPAYPRTLWRITVKETERPMA